MTIDDSREDGLELKCRIWKREPYPGVDDGEWVLEIEGEANDCSFVSRHTEPLTTPLEDVAGLPSLYTRPTPAALENREDGLVERLRNTARNLPDCGAPWAAEVVNEAADAIERLTRPAPAGDVVERVAREVALFHDIDPDDGRAADIKWPRELADRILAAMHPKGAD